MHKFLVNDTQQRGFRIDASEPGQQSPHLRGVLIFWSSPGEQANGICLIYESRHLGTEVDKSLLEACMRHQSVV